MTLYEIDKQILNMIDDDGQIADIDAWEQLQLDRKTKIENIGRWIKNLDAESTAIKNEEAVLAGRRKSLENKATQLRKLLEYALKGEKYESPTLSISWRKSKALEIEDKDAFVAWAQDHAPWFLRTNIEIAKKDITDALRSGKEIPLAQIVERQNMRIV